MNDREARGNSARWRTVLVIVTALSGLYRWLEHQALVVGTMPWLLPLAGCLGMHRFMHRHQGQRLHGHSRNPGDEDGDGQP